MRIGIDYSSALAHKTGIGRFTCDLVEELRERRPSAEFILYQNKGHRDLSVPQRIWWEAVELPKRAGKDQLDIFYSPGFSPPRTDRFPRVLTVHDLIGLIYPQNTRLPSRFYWSSWLPAGVRKADRLVASSESTKKDIQKFLKVPAEKIEVVPLAAHKKFKKITISKDHEALLAKYKVQIPFLISVSSLEPRKNHLKILQAYMNLKKEGIADFSIVIIGKEAGAGETLKNFIKENDLENQVRILGYVPDEDLVGLYNQAIAYINLSLYEGFGLPVLEAMSCGLTGLVSNCSSLPEVAGDSAFLVDPRNLSQVQEAMREIVINSRFRRDLAEKAYSRAQLFSMKATAQKMLNIFDFYRSNKV